MPADVQQRLIADTPLGRLGQTDDIADVVAFLCGHEARWITGQTLIANGGLR
jgi:3-oxoacyl-[acyl-carrier protein] reductase